MPNLLAVAAGFEGGNGVAHLLMIGLAILVYCLFMAANWDNLD